MATRRDYHREINEHCALCDDPADRAFVYRTVSGLSRHCTRVHGYSYRSNGRYVRIAESELEAARRRRRRRQLRNSELQHQRRSSGSSPGSSREPDPAAGSSRDPGVAGRCRRAAATSGGDRRPAGLPSSTDLGFGAGRNASSATGEYYQPPSPSDVETCFADEEIPQLLFDQEEGDHPAARELPAESAGMLPASPPTQGPGSPLPPPPPPPAGFGDDDADVEMLPPPRPQPDRPLLTVDDVWIAVNNFRVTDVEAVIDRLVTAFRIPWPDDRFRAIVMSMSFGRHQAATSLRHTAVVTSIVNPSSDAVLSAVLAEIERMRE